MNNSKFEEIYKDHAKSIYRFINFRTQKKELAEDLTSEVFIKCYQSDFESIENVKPWLFRVARNTIYDELMKGKNAAIKNNHEDLENIDESQLNQSLSNLETQVFNDLEVERIKEILNQLSPETSDVLTLKIWEELKFSEIAEIVNESEDSVKKRFYRGIEELKSKIAIENKSNFRLHSFTMPAILSGVFAVGNQNVLLPTSTVMTSILGTIATTLNIKLGTMTGVTSAAATGSKGFLAGLFATTTAKVLTATVLGASVIGGGATGLYLYENNDKDPVNLQPTSLVETDDQEDNETGSSCKTTTYTNENYPVLKFSYSDCEWTLKESEKAQSVDPSVKDMPPITDIILTNKETDAKLNLSLQPLPVFGFGPTACYKDDYKFLGKYTLLNTDFYIGRYKNDSNWNYATGLQKYSESIVTEGSFEGSDYCYTGDSLGAIETAYPQNKVLNSTTDLMSAIFSAHYVGSINSIESADEIILDITNEIIDRRLANAEDNNENVETKTVTYERKNILAGNPLAGIFTFEIPTNAQFEVENKGDLNTKYNRNFTEVAIKSTDDTYLFIGVHYEGFTKEYQIMNEISNSKFGALWRLNDGSYGGSAQIKPTGTCVANMEYGLETYTAPCGINWVSGDGIIAQCLRLDGEIPNTYFCDDIVSKMTFEKK